MRILYAIQGTGNGHLSRARDIVPLLHQRGELDLLISGSQADIDLPYPVKYRFKGLSFIFGKSGGVDLVETYKKSKIRRLLKEIEALPVEDYDLVISDFEPVSAWACYLRNKPCVALSHQAAVLHKKAPQPNHADLVGKALLKHYAPATTRYGFHFKAYDQNIFTPVIRRQLREMHTENRGHYTVYLPAYDDKRIIKTLTACACVQWQVFSKHNKKTIVDKNVIIQPVNNEAFLQSMATSAGVFCGAGFETPAEALFLGKKLLVIPMKRQYEQHCNAAALISMGVPVLKSLRKKYAPKIMAWTQQDQSPIVDYPDITDEVLNRVIADAGRAALEADALPLPGALTAGTFKKLSLKKIMAFLAT